MLFASNHKSQHDVYTLATASAGTLNCNLIAKAFAPPARSLSDSTFTTVARMQVVKTHQQAMAIGPGSSLAQGISA